MICKSPFMVGAVPYGCGQCLPCRINRRRVWSWRMYLESLCHDESSFVTLTYSDVNLPDGGSLQPRDTTLFLKRLRKSVGGLRIRYFLVGEYGEKSWRPHYHLALFGLGPSGACFVDRAWGLGHTLVAEFNHDTAQYIAGYVVKKMTHKDDKRLMGLHPEFARMSNRPGIGADAMRVVARHLHNYRSVDGDVPHQLMMGKSKSIPLGRYLRSRLRYESGFTEEVIEGLKAQFVLEKSAEVHGLLKAALGSDPFFPHTSKLVVVESGKGRMAQIEARDKIKSSRRSL